MRALCVKNLSYKYSQNDSIAVDDVSFEIEKGSYTAIVGLNGSGKSTLARMLSGLLVPSSGTIEYTDNPRIGIIFQSPKEQIVSGVVYRDTEFGPLNLHLTPAETELRTIESLNIVGMLDRASSSTSELSLGQTQKIAFSGIIALSPDVLIMDEAIAMMDPVSRQDILEFLRYCHKCGKTIIHITHDVEAIVEADRIIGMENGKIYYNGSKDEFISNKSLFEKIDGNKLPVTDKNLLNAFGKNEVSFKVKNLSFKYDENSSVNKISFDLHKGTITALTGPSGAGKSTVLELCAGLLNAQKGEIYSKSRPVLVQQNAQAALFETFAADDVAFGPGNLGMQGDELRNLVKDCMNKASLPFEKFADRHTFELSGGEQRRLAIAGILAMNSDVVLFDEPTAGLDCNARYNVLMMMKQLAAEGKTVLFSTHKKDEADFADREIKMKDGVISGDSFTAVDLTGEDEMKVDGAGNGWLVESYSGAPILEKLRKTSKTLSGSIQYEKSIIQKIPAWIRIVLFVALFILSICAQSVLFSSTMFFVMLLYCKISGFKIKSFFIGCIKILPFLLIFTLLQLIFHPVLPGEEIIFEWQFLTISISKILFCISALIRTFDCLGCICAFFISTPEFDLIDGLKILFKPFEIIKIPVRYVILILEIVLRFIPLLVDETICIIKTQLIRGGLGKAKGKMAKIKAVIPLIVPMILQTVKRSEALADAITVRCFE